MPKKEAKKVMYFLNDLIYEKLDTLTLFEEGNKEKIEKEYNKRYLYRQKIMRELDTRCDLYGLTQCAMVCSKCDSILTMLNSLNMKKESLGICEIGGILFGLSETRGLNKDQSKSHYVRETLKRMQKDEDYDFL
jgi:hypothetical protein